MLKKGIKIVLGLLALIAVLFLGLLAKDWRADIPVDDLKAKYAPAPSQFFDVDGTRLHVRDEGPRDDPLPIVLVHGTAASLHTWDGWAAALRGERRVIRFDLPAFGLTGPNEANDYREATYVRAVLGLMDALKVQRFVIAGNSLGGEVAWQTAVAAPLRVDSLILVDSAGYAFKPVSLPIGFLLARLPITNLLIEHTMNDVLMDKSVRSVYGDPARVTPELVQRYTDLALRAGNRHALVERFRQMTIGADAAKIKNIKTPTLIIWGGQDRLIPPDSAAKFHADIAGSRLQVFDDLGHVPHEEDPQRTVAAVKEFLRR